MLSAFSSFTRQLIAEFILHRAHDFISHAPNDEWSKIAPLRILSFDIECAGRKGIFPEPQVDPVIQIANMVTTQGEWNMAQSCPLSSDNSFISTGDNKPFIRNVFTLNSCSNIVGSQVLSFDDESQLLDAWQKFIVKVDPDVVIGYNTANFDIPYLMDRAKTLKVADFPLLGRMTGATTWHFSIQALYSPLSSL